MPGIRFTDQDWNLGPLHWEQGIQSLDHQGRAWLSLFLWWPWYFGSGPDAYRRTGAVDVCLLCFSRWGGCWFLVGRIPDVEVLFRGRQPFAVSGHQVAPLVTVTWSSWLWILFVYFSTANVPFPPLLCWDLWRKTLCTVQAYILSGITHVEFYSSLAVMFSRMLKYHLCYMYVWYLPLSLLLTLFSEHLSYFDFSIPSVGYLDCFQSPKCTQVMVVDKNIVNHVSEGTQEHFSELTCRPGGALVPQKPSA